MARYQHAADFGVAQVRASENSSVYRVVDLRINAVRALEYQIFTTDFALSYGKTVAYYLAKRDKLFEYTAFQQNSIGKGRPEAGPIS